MFSVRVPRNLAPNALSLRLDALRASNAPLLDLTATNPTTAGIPYPPDMLAPLADVSALVYRPEPLGDRAARAAVAADAARNGMTVAADRVVLTASTSEAYSILFKLLCDPGDEVMAPVPSYPLFDHLSALDAVALRTYRLHYHGRWTIDEHSVDESWTDRTRAVLAVSPNNPTGSVLSRPELRALQTRCAERGAALIVDEVFNDYRFEQNGATDPSASGDADPLTFRLGGLSKACGLPQVKLGWIFVEGPDELAERSLRRLEIICDTYLSVSTPVQGAAPRLLAQGAGIRSAIQERVRRNYTSLCSMVQAAPAVEVLAADGGWSAVLRVPSTIGEEELVLHLLEEDGVLVHPGYFFDFPHEAFLVISLLPPGAEFDEGVRRILERVHA